MAKSSRTSQRLKMRNQLKRLCSLQTKNLPPQKSEKNTRLTFNKVDGNDSILKMKYPTVRTVMATAKLTVVADEGQDDRSPASAFGPGKTMQHVSKHVRYSRI
jgi:hypothetical protein